jgi:hypothetical protein
VEVSASLGHLKTAHKNSHRSRKRESGRIKNVVRTSIVKGKEKKKPSRNYRPGTKKRNGKTGKKQNLILFQ